MRKPYIGKNGYRVLFIGPGIREYEHRLVMARKLGRPLEPGEQVHHINRDKLDNRPENLEICASGSEHKLMDWGITDPAEILKRSLRPPCLCGCGLPVKKWWYKWRVGHQSRARYADRPTVKWNDPRPVNFCACGCGTQIPHCDNRGRIKRYVYGHNRRGTRWSRKTGGAAQPRAVS